MNRAEWRVPLVESLAASGVGGPDGKAKVTNSEASASAGESARKPQTKRGGRRGKGGGRGDRPKPELSAATMKDKGLVDLLASLSMSVTRLEKWRRLLTADACDGFQAEADSPIVVALLREPESVLVAAEKERTKAKDEERRPMPLGTQGPSQFSSRWSKQW